MRAPGSPQLRWSSPPCWRAAGSAAEFSPTTVAGSVGGAPFEAGPGRLSVSSSGSVDLTQPLAGNRVCDLTGKALELESQRQLGEAQQRIAGQRSASAQTPEVDHGVSRESWWAPGRVAVRTATSSHGRPSTSVARSSGSGRPPSDTQACPESSASEVPVGRNPRCSCTSSLSDSRAARASERMRQVSVSPKRLSLEAARSTAAVSFALVD